MADITGLVPFSEGGPIPTIVVDSFANVLLPFSIFPEWRNDAGVQSFGGVKYVSVFEDGVEEGVTTAAITATTQQLTEEVGGIQLAGTADPAYLYKVRLRLRSELDDVNFVDKTAVFRVVTPLMVPFSISQFAADQQPDVVLSGGSYSFDTSSPSGIFPGGEIRLRDGRGGIVLPNDTSAWPADAQAYMASQMLRLRETIVTIDFLPGATEDALMRLKYRLKLNATLDAFNISEVYRRQDFSTWGYFTGDSIDFIDATVNMVTNVASIEFLRGLYGIGPRFEAVTVIGHGGSVVVNPALTQVGGTVDVSAAVNFELASHLSSSGLLDKFLLLVCTTDTQIYMREIPLRPKGQWDHVSQDGVTNYWAAQTDGPDPSIPMLFCRVLTDPYIEFPNLAAYFDPTVEFYPAGTNIVGVRPDVGNIRIYAGNAGSPEGSDPNVTYLDEADLFNNMFSIRMPDAGISFYVLDCRRLRRSGVDFTAIPSGTSYLKIVFEVRPERDSPLADSPTPFYEVTAYYPMCWDGQPSSWTLDDPAPDVPLLEYDRLNRELTVTLITGSNVLTSATALVIRGDVGEFDAFSYWDSPGPEYAVPLAADHTLVVDVSSILSDEAEFVEVEYTVAGVGPGSGRFIRRVSTHGESVMVLGEQAIEAHFTGGAIFFTDLSVVVAGVNGLKEITIIGDGAPIVIFDAQENTAYFLNMQGHSMFRDVRRSSWIDLRYTTSSGVETMRVFNSLVDYRSGNPRTFTITDKSAWGLGGQDREQANFSAPAMRFNVPSGTLETEADGRTYDFTMWRVTNLNTGRYCSFMHGMQPATQYQLGGVLAGISTVQDLLLAVLHRNGAQKTFTVRVDPQANPPYSTPRSTRLLGVL